MKLKEADSHTVLRGSEQKTFTKTGLNFGGQDNRQYNIIGKDARDILTQAVTQGDKDVSCTTTIWSSGKVMARAKAAAKDVLPAGPRSSPSRAARVSVM